MKEEHLGPFMGPARCPVVASRRSGAAEADMAAFQIVFVWMAWPPEALGSCLFPKLVLSVPWDL